MNVLTPTTLAPITLACTAKPQLLRSHTFAAAGDQSSPCEFSSKCNSSRLLSADGVHSTPNPNLSVIEIETRLRDRLRSKYHDVLQAFQSYDIDRSLCISKGQFRRVLEVHCLPMTLQQFEAIISKVGADVNGAVRYCDFLDKFCFEGLRVSSANRQQCTSSRCGTALSSSKCVDTRPDIIEKMLQEKIQCRLPEILSTLQLYDYNSDGTVQRHDLHRVLDRLCFMTSDKQFDRVYQKYDFRHNGSISYRDFLIRLGVRLERPSGGRSALETAVITGSRPSTANGISGIMTATTKQVEMKTLTDAELYEIEVDFCQKMRDNHANLKRMFLAFDRHLEGFIRIEDLRSVLNNFTIPMSDQVFSDLMARFGFKASGKISWEFFLNKFQDPLADRNGQTIPIKPSHKFFPNRGTDAQIDFQQFIDLLVNHIQNGYSTLKSAFLQLDKKHDGKISRGELRELLETTFAFRLSPQHFQKLMTLLDPLHTNSISYHKFLNLFEERESLAGHKWLKSCHRFNTPKAAIMAWSTLESNIRDKIEGSRVDVVSFLERRDLAHRGQVSLKVLRKVIEKFAVDITDEHFNNMVNRLATLDDSQLVDYKDFFFNLGVVLKPTDSCGVSSKIIKSSQQSAEEHQANQQYRSEEIDQRVINRASQMESEEIVTRIRDKLMQRTGDLHRAFQYYATKHHDRISRKNFRKFLENYGFVLSDDQFNRLCVELSFNKGYMRYVDFLHSFDQHCLWTPMSNSRPSNHRVNEIRGDEFGLSAEEVEARLRDKLRENFEDLREAFYKFDDDHNGILTKRNFRCMLDTFMLIMTDEEFEKFCQQMGINNTSRITYEDFLNVFQLRETKNGHTWLTSVHRYNKTKPTPKLSVDEAHDAVVQKMHEIWHDLAKAFQAMKSSRNRSVIQKSELRLMLSKFMIQLDKEQFNRLWARFDIDGKGFVSYDDFSKHLLADEFAPGDHDGVSGQIIDENREELKRRHQDQLSRLAENQLNEAQYVSALTTDDVLLHLRDHIQDQFTDLLAAFNSFDTFKRGFLTGRDFQDLLGRLNILLDDDQLFDFLDRLGLSMPKSKLMYKQFVEIFEEGKADSFKLGQPEDVQYPLVQFANLPACDVETRLRQKVAEQHDILLSACRSFDQLNTGLMLTVDLRRILDNFCFKMTDAHFRHLMQSFSKTAVPYDASFINYQQFLETFRDSNNKDPQKMMESLQQIMAISRCHSTEEIWACLREKVADNALVIGRAFADVDSVGQGAVSKSDFRSIINMHAVTISDEQFDKLWPVLPLNEFANVDYNYFMKLCMMEKSLERPQSSHGSYLLTPKPSTFEPRRPGSSCSATSRCGSALSMKSVERPFTPLVNAIETETKVRDFVHKHWKNIQKDCRGLDVENCGQISQQDFRNIAETYNFGLTDHEMFKLLLKYDLHNNDQFCYADFLRHFIIDSRVQPAAADAGRGSRQTAHNWLRRSSSGPNMITSRSSNHDEDPAVQLALDQIGDCVVANWKEMRRQLRRANPSGRATKMQFRQVLRNVNADLTEEQFARIFECFRDNGDEEKIRYDDFFRRYFQIK